LAALALSALLAGSLSATSARAEERRDGHHDSRRGDRDHGHDRDRWGNGYYGPPPVVYGAPYYGPPPVVYGPSVGIALPGVVIGIH
jgi:hypothetical protein